MCFNYILCARIYSNIFLVECNDMHLTLTRIALLARILSFRIRGLSKLAGLPDGIGAS